MNQDLVIYDNPDCLFPKWLGPSWFLRFNAAGNAFVGNSRRPGGHLMFYMEINASLCNKTFTKSNNTNEYIHEYIKANRTEPPHRFITKHSRNRQVHLNIILETVIGHNRMSIAIHPPKEGTSRFAYPEYPRYSRRFLICDIDKLIPLLRLNLGTCPVHGGRVPLNNHRQWYRDSTDKLSH